MKKAKIICTIGPASEDREVLKQMMLAGMNAARLNFSHGTREGHKKKMDLIKELRDELGLHISIILDTKGTEIRTGKFSGKAVQLFEGQKYTLTTEHVIGTNEICSVSYKGLPEDVKAGDQLLIDDGLICLTVEQVQGNDIICTVNNSGEINDYKSINAPGVKLNLPLITDEDKEDIEFGIEQDVDIIAASFVRRSSDVEEMKLFLEDRGASHIKIISKIENAEGVENIKDIIAVSDGIMIARGDLGVEIPAEQVPLIQKEIIKLCNMEGKPVITATQMLDSMIRNPRPTRAEVTDVANAIFDGTDAIMLSGETAIGKYPVETVKQMVRIAVITEGALDYESILREKALIKNSSVTNAIGHATCTSAQGLRATAILTPTSSGYTATVVSRFRPKAPIIAGTSSNQVARSLSLYWGVTPLVIRHIESDSEIFEVVIDAAIEKELIKNGDLIVITAGVPVGVGGTTNMLRIHIVGEQL